MTRSTIVFAAALLLSVEPAAASSCRALTAAEAVAKAAIVAAGKVTTIDYLEGPAPCGRKMVTLTVTEVLKGAAAGTLTALSDDGCHRRGGTYDIGDPLIAFFYGPHEATLTLGGPCGGTRHSADGSYLSEVRSEVATQPGQEE